MSVPNVYLLFLYLPEEVSLVSVMHVLPAGGLTGGRVCMDPLGNILSLQSNQNRVMICLALPMGICSQKSYLCVGA